MKKSGASILVYALEQIGVSKTFGIPGLYNSEIYNELNDSRLIEPVIVTHELSAGYMADAVSRTTNTIGTMVIVPGAGLTHSMSAIGEAMVDGIPLLVIMGGVDRDTGKSFQMHQFNLGRMCESIVKKYYYLDKHEDIIPKVYDAYNTATSGEPGPVLIEIPSKVQLMKESAELVKYSPQTPENNYLREEKKEDKINLFVDAESDFEKLNKAVSLLTEANYPCLYVGWGAKGAIEELENIVELLSAPVATTVQGVSVFPADHPLHTGIGFGSDSVPASQNAFKNCDCLLAVGLKFSELATGNYRMKVPENLIHIDINSDVFNKNYLAKVALKGDAKLVLTELIKHLKNKKLNSKNKRELLIQSIKNDKESYWHTWLTNPGEQMVTPGFFYNALRNSLPNDSILVADDGKHTLLTAELFPVYKSGYFICPTDYSGMGYGIPAAIGVKLLNRLKTVAAIIGDGALLMCGNELLTAYLNKLGIMVFVFRDSKSVRITEYFKPNKNSDKPTPLLGAVNLQGFADAVHAKYLSMKNDIDISGVLTKAQEYVKVGKSVLIEVNVDYSRNAILASSLSKPKSGRISFTEKIKMLFKTD